MFRRGARLLRYHQETFGARMEAFLVQVMRGLKVEKRWEMGMGHGVFAREPLNRGDLIMFDLPFLSIDIDQIPEAMRTALRNFDAEEKIQQVLNQTAQSVAFESRQDINAVKAYIVEHEIDVDMVWMALIACWGVAWCNETSPIKTIPMCYMSYVDDYYKEDQIGQQIMDLCHKAILDVTGIEEHNFSIEDFWVALFKVKSNVYRGNLYPVAPTLVNHSCWPNASFAEDGALIALRDIPADEQVMVALYGSTCKEVEEGKLAGEKFKCFTPGCQFSKRVPLPEPEKESDDPEILWRTPWHRMSLGGGTPGVDIPVEEAWQSPAKEKFKKMWKTEVTRAGRDLGNTPQLPGASPKRYRIKTDDGTGGGLLENLDEGNKGRFLVPNPTSSGSSKVPGDLL